MMCLIGLNALREKLSNHVIWGGLASRPFLCVEHAPTQKRRLLRKFSMPQYKEMVSYFVIRLLSTSAAIIAISSAVQAQNDLSGTLPPVKYRNLDEPFRFKGF